MYTRFAMDKAAKSFRLSNIGREREISGNAMKSIAEAVWSEIGGGDGGVV